MIHTKFDLGHLPAGTVVRVTLEGTEANVRLLDRSNYRDYAADRRHHYIGGHYRSSPVVLRTTSSDHYYVAVDLGGYQGRVKASVQVLTNA